MILFTNSSAMYCIALGMIAYFLINNLKKRCTIDFFIIILGLCIIVPPIFARYASVFSVTVINKINSFLGRGATFDWSSTDRIQHLENAWNMFCNSNLFYKTIGNGTGAYYFHSKSQSGLLMNNVEEAYNLYLSTLTDRGILGLLILISLFVFLRRKTIRNDMYSMSLFSGIVAQYIHWMLTGNMWVYFFWINVIFLISYYNYKKFNGVSITRDEGA
jgi:hypothetical protein